MAVVSCLTSVRNGYETSYSSDDFGIDCSKDGLTKQSFRDECDINTLVSRWMKTGVMPSAGYSMGEYLDVTGVPDYHTALNLVRSAQNQFGQLSSDLRDRFKNDPGLLLSFLSDDANRDEAIKLGLVAAPVEPSTGVASASQSAGDATPVGGSIPDLKATAAPVTGA